ncbi:MAG: formate dehydrogenase [Bacteroidetes bacterium]|nr:MAG: formate dehydrogenase [Bacteroidota bacterium]
MSKNISSLSGRQGLENNLFERISERPDKETLAALAEEFLVGKANTFGAVTFYDFLKPENQGKEVYVCNGTACLCAGTQEKLQQDLEKHVSADKIGHMTCLGRCHENAAFQYNGKNYSNLNEEELSSLFEQKSLPGTDDYIIQHRGTPVLTGEYDKNELFDLIRNFLNQNSADVLDEIISSGVRGRGGAGFPMGIKLEGCRNAAGKQKFIVCNADEGDPGAYSDRYLLEKQPLLVLIGMMAAGYVCGAEWGVLYIRGEYPESVSACESAIKELTDAGLLGQNINGSGFNYAFKVVTAQGAYICGEETALLSSLEGQRPEVRVRPPYPVQEGLFRMPTVVNNVETLAAVPYILLNGGEAYKKIGTERSSGTKLLSLDSFFNRPGIYEVDMGTSLNTVVTELGGGFKSKVKALHIGGPLGGLVPLSKINDLSVDFESFSQNGFLLGHASVICVPFDFPMAKYIEHLFEFTADESCGKCFPCRLGSVRGQEMFEKAQEGSYKIDRQLLDDLLETLEQGSLCALGGGVPLPIKNALQYFEEELKGYFE